MIPHSGRDKVVLKSSQTQVVYWVCVGDRATRRLSWYTTKMCLWSQIRWYRSSERTLSTRQSVASQALTWSTPSPRPLTTPRKVGDHALIW